MDADGRPAWARLIQAEREARTWTYMRAAGHLHSRNPAEMADIATIAKYWSQRWESGKIKPGDHYRPHLCALLRLPSEVFDSDAATAAPPVHFHAPTEPPTVSGDVSRPNGEELVIMAAHESADHARQHGASNVHPISLDQLEADVRSLAEDFVSGFPIPVVLQARALRDQAFSLLDGHQWPAQTRQLYSLAGWSCGLLAVGSSDFFGRYTAAAAQCRTAWLCAEMADDNALRAWVRALESGIAFWAGRWTQAAALAADSRSYARTPASAKRASTAQARALARLGDAPAVHQAILESESAYDLPESDADAGVTGFSEANRTRCAGTALLWLGDHSQAQRYLNDALTAYDRDEPDAYAHISVTRADLASAHLYLGDIDAAAEALAPLLNLPFERQNAGSIRRMNGLRRQLADPGFSNSVEASNLAARIESAPPEPPDLLQDAL